MRCGMQVTRRLNGAMACAVAICASAASMALAEGPRVPSDNPSADAGTGWNVLSIPAAGFLMSQNVFSMEYQLLPDGYAYVRDPADLGRTITFWAPVNLPSGARVGHLYLYAYDSLGNATSRVVADLRRFTGYGSICTDSFCTHPPVPPASESLASTGSHGENGYTLEGAVLDPPHTISNYRAHYAVVASFENPSQHGGLAFKGVEIWWKREISPPPSTASFTDVPATAQFFAEIEAMKAAGITGGCTPTAFCPDSTVTRRQMAAFFARALGLYWPF